MITLDDVSPYKDGKYCKYCRRTMHEPHDDCCMWYTAKRLADRLKED